MKSPKRKGPRRSRTALEAPTPAESTLGIANALPVIAVLFLSVQTFIKFSLDHVEEMAKRKIRIFSIIGGRARGNHQSVQRGFVLVVHGRMVAYTMGHFGNMESAGFSFVHDVHR